jgi:Flp pilus assembly protein TadG
VPRLRRSTRSGPGRHASRGQSLVEFALVIPIFLTLLLAIFDVGRVIWAVTSLNNAAREGARYAIVHGGSEATACPVGPMNPDRTKATPAASASCPYPSPSKQAVKDVATTYSIAGGGAIAVTVCYGAACTGDTDAAGASNKRGTPVTVTVASHVSLVTSSLLGLGSFSLSGQSTMLVNH